MKGPIVLCALCLILAAAAGFSADGGRSSGVPGDPGKVTRTIEVEMKDSMRFVPDHIEVKSGETIRFLLRNTGKLDHEMALGSPGELKEHAAMMRMHPGMKHDHPGQVTVGPGGTGELIWRFTSPGTVDFACPIPGHIETGMVGKIRVAGPTR
jgi:uncharacterized cupredoxin-like copper-binding protein